MDLVREKLSSIGAFCLFAGVLSSLLQIVGYELRIFRALNEQGPAVAWGIRLGFIAVGGVLFLLAPKPKAEPAQP